MLRIIVFVNYPRIPSPSFPQIIDRTLYIHFVRNNRRCESLLWTQLYTHNLSAEIAVTTSKDNDAPVEVNAANVTFYPVSSNRTSLDEDGPTIASGNYGSS
jgi:hypothetical protein